MTASGAAGSWYSAEPLLVSLRHEAREGIEARLGVRALEDLPLYDLDVSVDLPGATFTLNEDVWLTGPAEETWPDVVLRVYPNAAATRAGGTPPLRLISGACTLGSCRVVAESATALRVVPAAPLAAGARLRVHLAFAGTLDRIDASRTSLLAQSLEGLQSLGGEGSGNYGTLAMGDGIASFGNFYAVLARRTAAGWERDEKSAIGDVGSDAMAHVRARIEVPFAAKIAASGVVLTEEPAGPGRRTVRIAAAAVRDFAFVASEETTSLAKNVGGVVVRSTFRSEERAAGERVLDVAAAALADYDRRFGSYPYPALNISEGAIVGGAGGVEFSGLCTVASMFYHPPDSAGAIAGAFPAAAISGLVDSMIEFVVAHEVAHQYWHGLVGSDSREHPFVDEALAQYSAMIYLEDRYGPERAARDAMLNVKANYQMMRLMGQDDGAVDRPADAFASTVAYAGLVYGKGPYFYEAVRKALGDEAFFEALRGYVRRYAFRTAPSPATADTFAPSDPRVTGLARHWLLEAHGDDDLGKVDLTQMMGALMGSFRADRAPR